MKRTIRKPVSDGLAGWAEVIRRQSDENHRKEEQRVLKAAETIASARTMECQPRLQMLLVAQRQGILTLNDLFAELYRLAEIDPITLENQ